MQKYCGKLGELGIRLGKENGDIPKVDASYTSQVAKQEKRVQLIQEARSYQECLESIAKLEGKINIGLAFEEYYAGKVNLPAPSMQQIEEILETRKEAIEARRKTHEERIATQKNGETHAQKVEKAERLSQENQELDAQIAELEAKELAPRVK